MKYRTLFISDVHLGTSVSRSKKLLEFLKEVDFERLYLVGDIIDGWALKGKWYWTKEHNDVVRKIMKLAEKRDVIYIPGNHDEFARRFSPIMLGGIQVRKQDVHFGLDGKQYLVLHGDIFDSAIAKGKLMKFVGDVAYDFLVFLNTWHYKILKKFNLDYWSLSDFIREHSKEAKAAIDSFEKAAAMYAKQKGYDGIICGHIHTPSDKLIDDVRYLNTGDWVEHCSTICELENGEIEVISL